MISPSEIERQALILLHHRAQGIPNLILPEGQRLDDMDLAYEIQNAADTHLRDTQGY